MGDYTIKSDLGTVSDFRLDRYQITVGRFRKFVAAWNGGWRPTAGAGRHEHLNGGKGLLDVSGQNVHEKGWDPTYATSVMPSDAQLQCNVNHQTWTPTAGTNENLPIVCENWYEAYAFCIWDGGFLPSDMEVNYAASGGAEQRVYPWSSPPSSTLIDCTYANYSASCVPPTGQPNNVGSEFPKGSSKYGQADLSGNPAAWVLDVPAPPSSCNDCGFVVQDGSQRAVRGGQFDGDEVYALSSYTIPGLGGFAPPHRDYWIGARCARAP